MSWAWQPLLPGAAQLLASTGTTLSVPAASHSYTARVGAAALKALPAAVTHTYAARVPQVAGRVPAVAASHSYSGQVAKASVAAKPAATSHSYTGRVASARSAVNPGAVTHSYSGQVAKGTVTLKPGVTTHTYSPQTPTTSVTGGGVAVPAASHSYAGQTPKSNVAAKPAVASHTYTARTAAAAVALKPAAAAHTYSGLAAKGTVTLKPAATAHSYTGLVAAAQTGQDAQTPGAATHSYALYAPTVLVGGVPLGSQTGGAGGPGPRRQRWQVEFKGEVREFSTPQEAHDWLAHEIAEDKAERKAQKPVKGKKAAPLPAPKPEILFDGVEVTRWRYHGKTVADQLVSGDFLAKLARHIQDRLDDDDDAEAIAVIH